jgi:hypothetical protein
MRVLIVLCVVCSQLTPAREGVCAVKILHASPCLPTIVVSVVPIALLAPCWH